LGQGKNLSGMLLSGEEAKTGALPKRTARGSRSEEKGASPHPERGGGSEKRKIAAVTPKAGNPMRRGTAAAARRKEKRRKPIQSG